MVAAEPRAIGARLGQPLVTSIWMTFISAGDFIEPHPL